MECTRRPFLVERYLDRLLPSAPNRQAMEAKPPAGQDRGPEVVIKRKPHQLVRLGKHSQLARLS
jgi:hypothetical protein